jgi:hypothetical protein
MQRVRRHHHGLLRHCSRRRVQLEGSIQRQRDLQRNGRGCRFATSTAPGRGRSSPICCRRTRARCAVSKRSHSACLTHAGSRGNRGSGSRPPPRPAQCWSSASSRLSTPGASRKGGRVPHLALGRGLVHLSGASLPELCWFSSGSSIVSQAGRLRPSPRRLERVEVSPAANAGEVHRAPRMRPKPRTRE